MSSNVFRILTYILALLFALLGAVLFLAPDWSAANFPWKVSPFVAMTMGGWCLGNAVFAWQNARYWRWSLVYSGLLYLFSFGLLESAVLVIFADKLILSAALAWPYILSLALSIVTGARYFFGRAGDRPGEETGGEPVSSLARLLAVIFVILVALIALGGSLIRADSRFANGAIFPEPMTLFTIRAFAVFYGAIAISVIPLIWAKTIEPYLLHGRGGLALIFTITAAAVWNMNKFDFGQHPGGFIYLGAYIAALIGIGLVFYRYRFSPARPASLVSQK